eukprot:4697017-Alexandrium_andersonii.AAC.1
MAPTSRTLPDEAARPDISGRHRSESWAVLLLRRPRIRAGASGPQPRFARSVNTSASKPCS